MSFWNGLPNGEGVSPTSYIRKNTKLFLEKMKMSESLEECDAHDKMSRILSSSYFKAMVARGDEATSEGGGGRSKMSKSTCSQAAAKCQASMTLTLENVRRK